MLLLIKSYLQKLRTCFTTNSAKDAYINGVIAIIALLTLTLPSIQLILLAGAAWTTSALLSASFVLGILYSCILAAIVIFTLFPIALIGHIYIQLNADALVFLIYKAPIATLSLASRFISSIMAPSIYLCSLSPVALALIGGTYTLLQFYGMEKVRTLLYGPSLPWNNAHKNLNDMETFIKAHQDPSNMNQPKKISSKTHTDKCSKTLNDYKHFIAIGSSVGAMMILYPVAIFNLYPLIPLVSVAIPVLSYLYKTVIREDSVAYKKQFSQCVAKCLEYLKKDKAPKLGENISNTKASSLLRKVREQLPELVKKYNVRCEQRQAAIRSVNLPN